jgi:protease I
MQKLIGRRIIMVIAHRNFRDEELVEPKNILENQGATVSIASSSISAAKGMLGLEVMPDLSIDEIKVDEFDAIIFVGGSGATEFFHNQKAHFLAIEAVRGNKVLGAICLASSILANAGVLAGKKATGFLSEENNLRVKGANYTGAKIEIDDKIITAIGPESAVDFGKAIAQALS